MKLKMITAPKTFCIANTLTVVLVLSIFGLTAAETDAADSSICQIPVELIIPDSRHYDASLAVSVKTVLYTLKQKQKLTLVDFRRPEEFARLNIPGSINISLHAIKTKSFLKSTPIIIVNAGYDYRRLEQEVRQLTKRGFKVSILDGGLPAWKRQGGRLTGDIFALQDMKNISPQVFFRQKDYENSLVVDISPHRSEASRQLLPHARHLPILDDADGSMPGLRQLISKYKDKSFFSVLIFNASGKQYANAEKYVNRMGLNAFFLQGGVAAYQKYLEELQLSWKPRGSRIKKAGSCTPCGQKAKEESGR
jgi:rhodanese-related sulfurtransferase